MITTGELYSYFDRKIPRALSCDWDNDGLMVCADSTREVKKALFALDVTDAVADYTIAGGYDLIISHHPLRKGAPPYCRGHFRFQLSYAARCARWRRKRYTCRKSRT